MEKRQPFQQMMLGNWASTCEKNVGFLQYIQRLTQNGSNTKRVLQENVNIHDLRLDNNFVGLSFDPAACWILVLQTGIKPKPPAVRMQGLNTR